ncbi:hypothetical protein HDV00_010187, partial [Rhizophlyctis rosea]
MTNTNLQAIPSWLPPPNSPYLHGLVYNEETIKKIQTGFHTDEQLTLFLRDFGSREGIVKNIELWMKTPLPGPDEPCFTDWDEVRRIAQRLDREDAEARSQNQSAETN